MKRVPDRRLVLAAVAMGWARGLSAGESFAEHPGPIRWPVLTLLDGQTLGANAWDDIAAVVVFWASWCPFCRRHNARIEKLHRAASGPHLRILSVALDGDEAAVRQYMLTNGFHFPVLVGQAELRALFTPRRVIPMTCLVDRRGRLLRMIPGEMAEDDVLALATLAQRAV